MCLTIQFSRGVTPSILAQAATLSTTERAPIAPAPMHHFHGSGHVLLAEEAFFGRGIAIAWETWISRRRHKMASGKIGLFAMRKLLHFMMRQNACSK